MGARGEVSLRLAGVDYDLLPDFKAVDNIERQTGQSALQLLQSGDAITQHQLAIILTEGIRASGRASNDAMLQAYNVQAVSEQIFAERDRVRLTRTALLFLINIVGGGSDPGKSGAATDLTTTDPS